MTAPSAEAQRFEALYRAHYAAIARFVHRRIDPASAEEIVAETFAIAWRRLDAVPAEPLPWLYVVAGNLLHGERRSAARARHKAARFADANKLDHARDPADAFAEREHVLRAFSALPERDQEALRLIAWEGLDHRDAAHVFGTSRVAFAMRVSRARRRLAATLADADRPAARNRKQTSELQEGRA